MRRLLPLAVLGILISLSLSSCGLFGSDDEEGKDLQYRVSISSPTTRSIIITYRDGGGIHANAFDLNSSAPWVGPFKGKPGFEMSLSARAEVPTGSFTILVTLFVEGEEFASDSCSTEGCTASVTDTVP
jgi:hypothetical protein